jgi:hypothetical protein
VFPLGTEDFLNFAREKATAGIRVDICADDETYRELALHSDWLIIAEGVVTLVALPVAINLISEYLKERLSRSKKCASRGS